MTDTSARPRLDEIAPEEEEQAEKHWWWKRSLWTRIWQGAAIASVVVNLAAMAIEGSGVAIVYGIIALVIAPIVFYFQFQLQAEGSKLLVPCESRSGVLTIHFRPHNALLRLVLSKCATALRAVQNQLRQEVNKLQDENNQLSANATRMEIQVDR